MMLNNYNSNNKGWGKRDNFSNMFLGLVKLKNNCVDKLRITWGESQLFHIGEGLMIRTSGKPYFFHKEIHKKPTGLKKEIHTFSTVYPQVMEAYEI